MHYSRWLRGAHHERVSVHGARRALDDLRCACWGRLQQQRSGQRRRTLLQLPPARQPFPDTKAQHQFGGETYKHRQAAACAKGQQANKLFKQPVTACAPIAARRCHCCGVTVCACPGRQAVYRSMLMCDWDSATAASLEVGHCYAFHLARTGLKVNAGP